MKNRISYFNLFAILTAGILWLSAPFVAVNLFTIGNQPTGLEMLTGDFFYIGELEGTTAHIAACGSLAGIVGAVFGIITMSSFATKFFCFIGAGSMVPVFLELFASIGADDLISELFDLENMFEMFFDIFGFGYSAIFIIFIVLLFVRNYTLSDVQSTNSSESGATYTFPSVSSSISPEAERNREEKIRNNLKKSLLDEIEDELRDKIIAEMQQNKNVRNEHSDILTDTQNNIFCGHCGKKIPSDSAFCGHCGNPLS